MASFRHVFVWLVGSGCLLTVGWACTGVQPQERFQVGQIYEVQAQRPVQLAELSSKILEADVVYIGEEHYTPAHIEAALTILGLLVEAGRKPALGIEMFSWDGQPALNRWVQGEIQDEEEFLREAGWKNNWGGDFTNYRPLAAFARTHRVPLFALNPPKPLVRLVATKGLRAALLDPAMEPWDFPETLPLDDPEYRRVIYRQIEACHPGLPQAAYERIFEASVFRDEGMARIIRGYVEKKSSQEGPMVSYTGSGHIQYHLPVPDKVQAGLSPPIKDVTVYLMAVDASRMDDVLQVMKDQIADYVWLTPPGPGGLQAECG